MTFKTNRAPLQSIIKLYASFHHHVWIQTGVTVRKRLSWVVTSVTLTFDLWPRPFAWTLLLSLVITPENFMTIRWWEHSQKGVTGGRTDRRTDWTIHRAAWSQLKTIGHLFYATSSFVQHFIPIGEFKLELQSGNSQSGSNSTILELCDLEIWQITLKNNRTFWRMTLKKNKAPLLSNIKLYVSFHHHMWIQTGVTVRKLLSWVVTSVTLTVDLWPCPFAWTLPWSLVITPENFMMIRWWKQSTRQIWGIWKLRPAYSPETPNLGQNRWCFVPCDLEIWWMTLENNRASLCCFKLCATFHSHRWIQTWVTVRKRPIWVKFDDF